tara:strand:- start:12563 stop:13387 length:825 start_codon:yes stop_codon:yes gene_type:complete
MIEPIYFVHISDTHLGPDRAYEAFGRRPYDSLSRLLDAIKALPTQPVFVMHTGDVASGSRANLGVAASYRLAEDQFSSLGVPVYYAVGNHDDPVEVLKLKMGPKTAVFDESEPIVSYTFEAGQERFVVLHSQGPHEEVGAGGKLPAGQLAFLEQQFDNDRQITVFLHHCPLDLDSDWFRDRVDMKDGETLHQALLPYRDRVRGVFFGHVHRGVQIIRDGIHYNSVSTPFCGLNYWPHVSETDTDTTCPLPFNFVTLTETSTIVKEHSVSLENAP